MLRNRREGLQQKHGLHDQIVEVERRRGLQPRLVALVDPGDDLGLVGLRPFQRCLRVDQLVLQVRDLGGQRSCGVLLGVDVQARSHQLRQSLGVGRVVNGEGRLHPELAGLGAKYPHAHGVERRYPHRAGPVADQIADPFLHLPGGLVGEGDGQDLAGLGATGGEQVGDPAGQHPGLTGTCTGHHQQRSTAMLHCRSLRRVEPLQQFVGPLPGAVRTLSRSVRGGVCRDGIQRRGREVEKARHDGHNATWASRQTRPVLHRRRGASSLTPSRQRGI